MHKNKTTPIHHLVLYFGLLAFLLSACGFEQASPTPLAALTIAARFTEESAATMTAQPALQMAGNKDWLVLSLNDNGYAHLFAYDPYSQRLVRITQGQQDDVAPTLSPDQTRLAFASRRNGRWDLYLMELVSGTTTRLTNTLAYDGAPSWSPDSQWLAFETYLDENLEIAVLSAADPSQPPIRLTADPSADHSPAWAPQGRQIAFVSSKSGDSEIWLADLDRTDQRYINLSNHPQSAETHPVWSNDGQHLAWGSTAGAAGMSGIYVWEPARPEAPAQWVANGDWATWNATGDQLAIRLRGPNQDFLTISSLAGNMLLPPVALTGNLNGLTWQVILPVNLPQPLAQAAAAAPTALWSPAVIPVSEGMAGRANVVPLDGVEAPVSRLHDMVDEAFSSLRQRAVEEAGWDVMANLENAFVPITTPLDPGLGEDWLYTGRAFALNRVALNAGWIVATREDFGPQTYWRVFVRTQMQDGSQGMPLHEPPWNLAARYNLDPRAYEQGGEFAPVPSGYWIDFTSLANAYSWERLPALSNWRTFYNGTRVTEFVITSGKNWYDAMLEIYPPEALLTPTEIAPPTRTPSPTVTPSSTPAPTRTPIPSRTPTTLPPSTQIPPTPTP